MTNPYYNRVTDFIPDTSVRSSDLDSELNAVVRGFDLLGDPSKIGNGGLMWGVDSGTANNYVYENDFADEDDAEVLIAGQLISFSPLNSSTGASVISYNGGDNMSIVRNDGSPTQANDVLIGVPLVLIHDIDNDRWVIVGSTNAQTLAAFRPGVSTQPGATYTVTAGDENTMIDFTHAVGAVVTAPSDSTEDLEIGYIVHLIRAGDGTLTVVPDTGVTLRYAYSLAARAQYSAISLMKVAANTFQVVGDIG